MEYFTSQVSLTSILIIESQISSVRKRKATRRPILNSVGPQWHVPGSQLVVRNPSSGNLLRIEMTIPQQQKVLTLLLVCALWRLGDVRRCSASPRPVHKGDARARKARSKLATTNKHTMRAYCLRAITRLATVTTSESWGMVAFSRDWAYGIGMSALVTRIGGASK